MPAQLFWQDAQGNTFSLAFDVVTAESYDTGAVKSDHPVESGAPVTDHVRATLGKVTLSAFVTNHPIDALNRTNPDAGVRGVHSSVLLDVAKPTSGTFGVGAVYDFISARISSLFVVAKPPPAASVLTFNDTFSATKETLDILEAAKNSAQLFRISSRDLYVENYVITSLSFKRGTDTGSGLDIDITLEELRIVDTRTTTAPIPAEPRAKPIAGGGAQGNKDATSPKKSQSVAKAGLDYLKGLLP